LNARLMIHAWNVHVASPLPEEQQAVSSRTHSGFTASPRVRLSPAKQPWGHPQPHGCACKTLVLLLKFQPVILAACVSSLGFPKFVASSSSPCLLPRRVSSRQYPRPPAADEAAPSRRQSQPRSWSLCRPRLHRSQAEAPSPSSGPRPPRRLPFRHRPCNNYS